ncbi:hypothetical protein L208DRAFT_1376556 [Tricholoma matsutake]|nr:hypothetical protein L208DRAFT_1376556 [Tricholoma matsutake 945]
MIIPELGITEYLSYVSMPVVEEICIIYPGWCTKKMQRRLDDAQGKVASNEGNNHKTKSPQPNEQEDVQDVEVIDKAGGNEEPDSDEDSAEKDDSESTDNRVVINRHELVECCHMERWKIIQYFPNTFGNPKHIKIKKE